MAYLGSLATKRMVFRLFPCPHLKESKAHMIVMGILCKVIKYVLVFAASLQVSLTLHQFKQVRDELKYVFYFAVWAFSLRIYKRAMSSPLTCSLEYIVAIFVIGEVTIGVSGDSKVFDGTLLLQTVVA